MSAEQGGGQRYFFIKNLSIVLDKKGKKKYNNKKLFEAVLPKRGNYITVMDENNGGRNNLGERLKEMRMEQGLSQSELAARLYVSRQAVSQWERGENDPSLDMLKNIAAYFNVSVGYLLGEEKETAAQESVFTEDKGNLRNRKKYLRVSIICISLAVAAAVAAACLFFWYEIGTVANDVWIIVGIIAACVLAVVLLTLCVVFFVMYLSDLFARKQKNRLADSGKSADKTDYTETERDNSDGS